MATMLGNNEFAFKESVKQFWVIDAMGLVTDKREILDFDALPFARKLDDFSSQGLREGMSLLEVVRKVKPDVLLGLSSVGGLFSREVLEALKDSTSARPALLAMSNPTKNAECTPEEAFSIVGDHIIFASGSPFNDVKLDSCIKEEEVLQGIIYPPIPRIRDITKEVAAAVVRAAIEEDLAEGYREMDARMLHKLNQEAIVQFVKKNMWTPVYPNLVYKK